jgi:glyoxylase-like metal-dependent hydrolase (beta-lactamase superfamily II)
VDQVRVYEMLLTHGHDDHTGSAAALAARTGARVVTPRDEAPVITRDRLGPALGFPSGRFRCSST